MTLLSKPEAPILRAASTVTVFSTPDTVRVSQLPTISTVLDTPLTLTEQSSQLTVICLCVPETLKVEPGGAYVGPGADVVDGVAVVRVGSLATVDLAGRVVDGPEIVGTLCGSVGLAA